MWQRISWKDKGKSDESSCETLRKSHVVSPGNTVVYYLQQLLCCVMSCVFVYLLYCVFVLIYFSQHACVFIRLQSIELPGHRTHHTHQTPASRVMTQWEKLFPLEHHFIVRLTFSPNDWCRRSERPDLGCVSLRANVDLMNNWICTQAQTPDTSLESFLFSLLIQLHYSSETNMIVLLHSYLLLHNLMFFSCWSCEELFRSWCLLGNKTKESTSTAESQSSSKFSSFFKKKLL